MSPRKETRSTNPHLVNLIRLLRKKSSKNEANIWRDIASRISAPRRRRDAVNISKINRYTKDNDQVAVAGKVLGAGIIDHPVTVAALDFSVQARHKILGAKGKCMSIPELVEMNPKGADVKIMG